MRVLMVDDHELFLDGMKTLLGVMVPGIEVDPVTRLEDAFHLSSMSAYELVLLDWHLADCDGGQVMLQLREAGCSAPIVVLSGETDPRQILGALEMGAAGFIPKHYNSRMMIEALDKVLAGCVYLPPETAQAGARPGHAGDLDRRLAELTPRQVDVYRAAARGLPNKLIARELGIEPSTVKSHLSAVYAALGVRNRTEAAFQASREGMRVFPALREASSR